MELLTHPEATEARKCRVEGAAVATEQFLNRVFLLGWKLRRCIDYLLLLDLDPPLQNLFVRHDHWMGNKKTYKHTLNVTTEKKKQSESSRRLRLRKREPCNHRALLCGIYTTGGSFHSTAVAKKFENGKNCFSQVCGFGFYCGYLHRLHENESY